MANLVTILVISALKLDNGRVEHFEKEKDDCSMQYGLLNNVSVPVPLPVPVPLLSPVSVSVPVTVPVIVLL